MHLVVGGTDLRLRIDYLFVGEAGWGGAGDGLLSDVGRSQLPIATPRAINAIAREAITNN